MVFQDISSLKTFTSTIELVVSKEQDFIKFVNEGSKVKKRLFMWVHYTIVDWILTADLIKNTTSPSILLTQNYNLTSPFILIQPKR